MKALDLPSVHLLTVEAIVDPSAEVLAFGPSKHESAAKEFGDVQVLIRSSVDELYLDDMVLSVVADGSNCARLYGLALHGWRMLGCVGLGKEGRSESLEDLDSEA